MDPPGIQRIPPPMVAPLVAQAFAPPPPPLDSPPPKLGPVGGPEIDDFHKKWVGEAFEWAELQTASEIEDEFVLRQNGIHDHFVASVRARVCKQSQHLDEPLSPHAAAHAGPAGHSIPRSPLASRAFEASSFNPNGDAWRCGDGGADTMMDAAMAYADVRHTPKRRASELEDGSETASTRKTPRTRRGPHFNLGDDP